MAETKDAEVIYEVIDLDSARAVASIVRAIHEDPEAMRIIRELRDSGCSREQFAEKFEQAWMELEREKEPRR